MDRGVIIPNSTSAPLSHIPILTIIQPTLHNSNNVRLREIGIWGHLRCALKCGPAEGTGTHLSWHPRQINTYKEKKKSFCQGCFSFRKKKKLLRWIEHDTPVTQQAAPSKSDEQRALIIWQTPRKNTFFSKVILNGAFQRLTQAWVLISKSETSAQDGEKTRLNE